MCIVAHMLWLRHVLNVVDDLSQGLEGEAEVFVAVGFGWQSQGVVERLPRILVGKILRATYIAGDVALVFHRPVRRSGIEYGKAEHGQGLVI